MLVTDKGDMLGVKLAKANRMDACYASNDFPGTELLNEVQETLTISFKFTSI